MELKLETVLIIAIAVIVTGAMVLKVDSSANKHNLFTKELEFTNTTFTEVDTKKLQGRAYGTYGIRENGELTLNNLVYFTENIKYLVADKGHYVGDILNMEGNIELAEKQGYVFKTERAKYNQKTELLRVNARFEAVRDENIFQGIRLVYHTGRKDMYGEGVKAVFHTAE